MRLFVKKVKSDFAMQDLISAAINWNFFKEFMMLCVKGLSGQLRSLSLVADFIRKRGTYVSK